ncbi:MAG: type IV pilin [Halobacteria archaeon]
MKIDNKYIAEKKDDAVSPVIGVILMVSITVIIAAVIGKFVLGKGSGVKESPQAALSVEDPDGDSNSRELKVTLTDYQNWTPFTCGLRAKAPSLQRCGPR